MYEQGFRWWNLGYAAAIAFMLFAIILAATLLQLRLRQGPDDRPRGSSALLLYAVLVAGPRADARAAPLDALGLADAGGRGQRLPAAPRAERGHARALRRALFARLDLARSFLNSMLVASAITLISLLINSLAGYAFAKLAFPGRERIFRAAAQRAGDPGARSRCCRCS